MTENNEDVKKNLDENIEKIQIIEEIVEGYWICPNCNAKNRGSEQQCDSCGAIRGENVKFFCDDDAPAITDEKELELANAGADWICQRCGNTSPAGAAKCSGCGCTSDEGKKREQKEVPLETETAKKKSQPPKSSEPSKPLPMGFKIGCGIFALIFMILVAFSCQQKAGKIEVVSNSWHRTVERQQFKTIRESAWKNEVPSGAIKISSSREIKKYNQVPDGTEEVDEAYTEKVKTGEKKVKDGKVDLGNGRFKIKYKMVPEYKTVNRTKRVTRQKYRKVPEYDEKVAYDINKWVPIGKVESSGTEKEPVWPDAKLKTNSPPQVGDVKEGQKTEQYSVKVIKIGTKDEIEVKKIKDKPMTFDQFMKLRKGTQWEAVFSGLGTLREIKLEPDKK